MSLDAFERMGRAIMTMETMMIDKTTMDDAEARIFTTIADMTDGIEETTMTRIITTMRIDETMDDMDTTIEVTTGATGKGKRKLVVTTGKPMESMDLQLM
jgi:hypothetical protein